MHKVCPWGTAPRRFPSEKKAKEGGARLEAQGQWTKDIQLSRGRLRGQSEAHMPLADILPLCFPAEASFEQMLRVKKIRVVRNIVWLVRHYPKLHCRMPASCQTLLESTGVKSIHQCPLWDSSQHFHDPSLATWHKNNQCPLICLRGAIFCIKK